MHDRELREMGLLRSRDGRMLNNKNGFYDDVPDTLNEYDINACIAIRRETLRKLIIIADPNLLAECNFLNELVDIRL